MLASLGEAELSGPAEEVMEEMDLAGVPPDDHTMAALMRAYRLA